MNYDPRKSIRQAMMIARREVTAPNKTSIKGQRHMLAYITPYEAELLARRGGSGRITEYGVPAFDDGDGAGNGGGDGSNDADGMGGGDAPGGPGGTDAPDAPDAPDQEQEQQQTAPTAFGPPGNLSALSTPDPGPPSGPHSGFGSAMNQDPEGTQAAANMNTAVDAQQAGKGVGIADTGGVAPTGFGAAPGIAEAFDAYDKGIIGLNQALGYAALSAFSPPGVEFGQVTDEVGNQAVGGRGNIGGAIGGIAGMATGVPGAGTVGGMIGSQVADALGVPSHTFSFADGGQVPSMNVGDDPTVQRALSYARKVNPIGLYSHAADVAANLPQEKGTLQQMFSMLAARGVKPDEINNSGAQDAFGNQKTVAKQDLVTHFQQNMPDIQEKKLTPTPSWGRLAASNFDPEIYAAAASPAKFFEWTTAYMEDKNPEDIDYREVLLHSRPYWNENAINDWVKTQAYNKAADFGAISSTEDWNNLPEDEKNKFTTDAEQRLNYLKSTLDFKNRSERSALLDQDKNYFGNHWAVPNVIGHIRMHDRDDGDTLHVEELQSDWGQAKRNGEDVPEHPLINSTNTWTDLLLKRVLREAARGNYKRIAWTPGQDQAERYDLSQQIHQLNYDPEDKVLSYYHKDNGWDDVPQRVNPDEIQKYVGKELAKNLLSQPPSPLNGSHSLEINAQVGGEGMRAYYDKIVPTRIMEVAKKLGVPVKVEPHKIETKDGEKTLHSIQVTPELKDAVSRGMPVYKDGGSVEREHLRIGGSPEDDVVRQALQRVASPFSEDPEVVQQALRIASSLKVPQGAEFGTGSFYSVKQPMAVSDVSTQVEPLPGVDLAAKKNLSWEDFYKQGKGGTILNVGGDRSNLGRLTHINNKELSWPVDLHAGPKYMMEPNPGAVWANNPSHATALRKKILEAAEKGPVYGVYAPMGAQAVDSSHNMFDAVMAQIPSAGISKKDAKEFDDAITNGLHVKGNDPKNVALRENAKKELEGWPGILNAKEASEYARNMPGGHRSAIVKFMDSKKWRDMNFPAIGITRVAITDPELKAAAGNMLGHRVVEFDPEKIAEETKFQHSTYTSPTSGRYVGDVPLVQRQYAMPDVVERLLQKPTVSGQIVHPYSMDPLGRSTARKLFEEQKQLQPVNERMINTIGEGLERQKDYGLKRGGNVVDQALRMTAPDRPMVALADLFQRQLRGRPPS